MADRKEAFKAKCMEQGWVCPQPQQWNQMWELLPDRRREGHGWKPPLPLILGAWWDTSDLEKTLRFDQHNQWAADHSALDTVLDYLETLSPEDWHRR